MSLVRSSLAVVVCLFALISSANADLLANRPVVLDSTGKLAPWSNKDSHYDHVMRLAWGLLKRVPIQDNGLPSYMTYPRFVGAEGRDFLRGVWWAHNPASLNAMLADSAAAYYAYSGDRAALDLAERGLAHHLAHGTTPSDWAWASVPYASSNPGETQYRGADDRLFCHNKEACGRGDGIGFIEPDKAGELGYQYLRYFQITGKKKYRDAAIACGRALARNVRVGDERRSPWPFRVDARTGTIVREEYSANTIGPIKLFDELIRLELGEVQHFRAARKIAWDWMMRYPMLNHNWSGYFEDIVIHENPAENTSQYSALETARYLLENPHLDDHWREHVEDTLAWVTQVFAADVVNAEGVFEPGIQYGAETISEQQDDLDKMASHTSRFASVLALYHERTGDARAKDRAYRSFNWASYFCRDNGIVKSSVDEGTGYWFSDGYGDYMRHFLSGMASVPEWAPSKSDHILRSSSVVRSVSYEKDRVAYETADASSIEVLRVTRKPVAVWAGKQRLEHRTNDISWQGYLVEPVGSGFVVRVKHDYSGKVEVVFRSNGRRGD